jgi:hypothetical protein
MLDQFFSLAFQSALNLGALLFGVLGFLYSVYAMYSTEDDRPRIVQPLITLCRTIAVLITINFLVFAYSLYQMLPFGTPINWPHTILASGLVMVALATAVISLYWTFRKMT